MSKLRSISLSCCFCSNICQLRKCKIESFHFEASKSKLYLQHPPGAGVGLFVVLFSLDCLLVYIGGLCVLFYVVPSESLCCVLFMVPGGSLARSLGLGRRRCSTNRDTTGPSSSEKVRVHQETSPFPSSKATTYHHALTHITHTETHC